MHNCIVNKDFVIEANDHKKGNVLIKYEACTIACRHDCLICIFMSSPLDNLYISYTCT